MRRFIFPILFCSFFPMSVQAHTLHGDSHALKPRVQTIFRDELSTENILARFFFRQSTDSFSQSFKNKFADIDDKTFSVGFLGADSRDVNSVFGYLNIVFMMKNGTAAISIVRLVKIPTAHGVDYQSQMLFLLLMESSQEKEIVTVSLLINPLYEHETIHGISVQEYAKRYFDILKPSSSEPNLSGD